MTRPGKITRGDLVRARRRVGLVLGGLGIALGVLVVHALLRGSGPVDRATLALAVVGLVAVAHAGIQLRDHANPMRALRAHGRGRIATGALFVVGAVVLANVDRQPGSDAWLAQIIFVLWMVSDALMPDLPGAAERAALREQAVAGATSEAPEPVLHPRTRARVRSAYLLGGAVMGFILLTIFARPHLQIAEDAHARIVDQGGTLDPAGRFALFRVYLEDAVFVTLSCAGIGVALLMLRLWRPGVRTAFAYVLVATILAVGLAVYGYLRVERLGSLIWFHRYIQACALGWLVLLPSAVRTWWVERRSEQLVEFAAPEVFA